MTTSITSLIGGTILDRMSVMDRRTRLTRTPSLARRIRLIRVRVRGGVTLTLTPNKSNPPSQDGRSSQSSTPIHD